MTASQHVLFPWLTFSSSDVLSLDPQLLQIVFDSPAEWDVTGHTLRRAHTVLHCDVGYLTFKPESGRGGQRTGSVSSCSKQETHTAASSSPCSMAGAPTEPQRQPAGPLHSSGLLLQRNPGRPQITSASQTNRNAPRPGRVKQATQRLLCLDLPSPSPYAWRTWPVQGDPFHHSPQRLVF